MTLFFWGGGGGGGGPSILMGNMEHKGGTFLWGNKSIMHKSLPMRGIWTDIVCNVTFGSRTPGPSLRPPFPGSGKLQIPLKYRTMSAYNWDLGVNAPVKTQNVPMIIIKCESH